MEESDICLTRIKRQNRKKHQQSKKHKSYYSNLIINKYTVRNYENEKFKNTFQPYYDEHKKKFRDFTVWIIFKNNNEVVYEIKLPNNVFVEKKYRIGIGCVTEPLIRIEPCVVYLDILDLEQYLCNGIIIIFISDPKDMTFIHYMQQPKSMLTRRLVRNIIDGNYDGYDYNWLPECFKFDL